LAIDDSEKPLVELQQERNTRFKKKVKFTSTIYVLLWNNLYKKVIEVVLLKCLNGNEAYIVVKEVH